MLGARSLADLYGLMAFLHLDPLAERRLFVRTLERPIKSGDPLGLMRLQVASSTLRSALAETKTLLAIGISDPDQQARDTMACFSCQV